MFETILLPYDGGQSSDRALETAIAVAKRTGATIHVVYVIDLDDIPRNLDELIAEHGDDLTIEKAGQERLTDAVERVTDASVAVEHSLLWGDAATTLLEYTETTPVDLIVIGYHEVGRLQRFLEQGVAEQVVQAATVPVLTVPEEISDVASSYDTVLLATDGRSGTRRATDIAFGLAETYEAPLWGLYVIDSRFVSSPPLRSILEHEGEKTERDLEVRAAQVGIEFLGDRRKGSPARAILAACDDHGADIIVMGTRGQSGIDRLLMGSVTSRVLRKSSVPVLTVRTVD